MECACKKTRQRKPPRSSLAGILTGKTSGNSADKPECQAAFRSGSAADCIVYDDEDCEVEDWSQPIVLTRGQSRAFKFDVANPFDSLKFRDTIESVSVRRGCRLEVFDDSSFGADDQGDDDMYVFRAPANSDLHVTLDESPISTVRDLDDDINSIRCSC